MRSPGPISCIACWMPVAASLSAAPGARLKLMVTDGNMLWDRCRRSCRSLRLAQRRPPMQQHADPGQQRQGQHRPMRGLRTP
jgi:hypothetical protein